MQLEKLLNWINARTIRELIILTLTSLFIIYFFWYGLLIKPLWQKQDSLQVTINSTQKMVNNLQAQIQALNVAAAQGNRPELKQEHAQLIKQLSAIEQSMKQYKQQLIPPKQILTALQSILNASQSLHLVRLESLPAQAATENNTPANEKVFTHTYIIELRGSYFATLKSLQQLETLPWFLYWDDFNYQVTNYPEAKITIKLHVLSNEEK